MKFYRKMGRQIKHTGRLIEKEMDVWYPGGKMEDILVKPNCT